jgi:hypothetical protein
LFGGDLQIATISVREFEQDPSGAKHAANAGPLIISEQGQPAYVLAGFGEYGALDQIDLRDIAFVITKKGQTHFSFGVVRLAVARNAREGGHCGTRVLIWIKVAWRE